MSNLLAKDDLTGPTERGAMHLGFWSAIVLALVAAAAFALGITTPPRSGPFCTDNCIAYPFTDVVQFVPRDYYWVVPGTLLLPVFVVISASIHPCVRAERRHLTLIALCFASIAAAIVAVDYFIQFQVIEPSLIRGETSGLSLFTQYNPHGLFIALEDLGYLAFCVSLVFTGAGFPGIGRLAQTIRWTALVAGLSGFACFAGMTWHFGLNLEYRFEVAIITITWTALSVLGVMLAIFFRITNSRIVEAGVKVEVHSIGRI